MFTRAFVILISSLLMLCSCQTFTVSSKHVPLPSESRLGERIQEFYTALGNNDVASWYAMTSPAQRQRISFEQFKKNLRWDERAAAMKKSRIEAKLWRVCSCRQEINTRCVLITELKTSVNGNGVETEKPLEMWEYSEGEWYWGYLGPDSQGRCPGER